MLQMCSFTFQTRYLAGRWMKALRGPNSILTSSWGATFLRCTGVMLMFRLPEHCQKNDEIFNQKCKRPLVVERFTNERQLGIKQKKVWSLSASGGFNRKSKIIKCSFCFQQPSQAFPQEIRMVEECRWSGLSPVKPQNKYVQSSLHRDRINHEDGEKWLWEWPTHSVFEVGYVDVPAQSDKVHVNYTEFGREEVEVDHLSWRPNTPVSLQTSRVYTAEKPTDASMWSVCSLNINL